MIISKEKFEEASDRYYSVIRKANLLIRIQRPTIMLLVIISVITAFIFSDSEDEYKRELYRAVSAYSVLAIFISPFIIFGLYNIMLISVNKYRTYVVKGSGAVMRFYKAPYSQQAINSLSAAVGTVKNRKTEYTLRRLLFQSHMMNGNFTAAFDSLYYDKNFFEKNKAYELEYNYMLIRYYSEGISDAENAKAAYLKFKELFSVTDNAEDDFRLCSLAYNADIYMSYVLKDYKSCSAMIMSKIENTYGKAEKSAVDDIACAADRLMLAECLYYMGEYDESLGICDQAGPVLVKIPYRLGKANELSARLHSLTDNKE